jgi:hypothetical protein
MTVERFINRVASSDVTGHYRVEVARRMLGRMTPVDFNELCQEIVRLRERVERSVERDCGIGKAEAEPRYVDRYVYVGDVRFLAKERQKELAEGIVELVCDRCNVPREAYSTAGKKQDVVFVKKMVIYMLHKYGFGTHGDIGRLLGLDDHKTVCHHISTMPSAWDSYRKYRVLRQEVETAVHEYMRNVNSVSYEQGV